MNRTPIKTITMIMIQFCLLTYLLFNIPVLVTLQSLLFGVQLVVLAAEDANA